MIRSITWKFLWKCDEIIKCFRIAILFMHPNIYLFQVTIRIIEIWHGEDGKCNYSHSFNHTHFLMENMQKYDNVHHHRKHFLFCILECGGKYWLMLHYIWVFGTTRDVIKKDGFSETERGVHTLYAKDEGMQRNDI